MVLKRAFVSDFESSNCQKPLDIFNRSNYNLCSIDAQRNFDLKILRHFLAKNVSDSPKIQIYVLSIRSISTFGAFGLQIPAIPVRFGENAVVLSIVRVFRCYHVLLPSQSVDLMALNDDFYLEMWIWCMKLPPKSLGSLKTDFHL